ncbi:MAG: phytoene/squalene synthase family protein [Acidobacteriota bacterium]
MSRPEAAVRALTRARGGNFSLGFRLLPAAKRRAVYAAYAACRIPDDIVDEAGPEVGPAQVLRALDEWVAEVEATYAGRPTRPETAALAAVLPVFPVPKSALLGLVEGCRMDLEISRYETFSALEGYCERVAVTISEISLAIFGAIRPEAHEAGRSLAMALQLTNICRDVGEDAGRGRIYLPLDELARHGVSEDEVLRGAVDTAGYRALMRFECARAASYFAAAGGLPQAVERDSRAAVRVMTGVYRRVLARVAADPVRAWAVRAELTRVERVVAVVGGLLGRGPVS